MGSLNGTASAKAPLEIAVDCRPPKAGPECYVLRLKGAERYTFTIYSKALWGVWVHWQGDRSAPHYTDEARCQGCVTGMPKRWKGFLHCFCHEKQQEVFLELTPASAASLQEQVLPGEPLRGLGIYVQRTKGDNGRLLVRVSKSATAPLEALPAERDPQSSLRKLWGLDRDEQTGREFPAGRGGFFGR